MGCRCPVKSGKAVTELNSLASLYPEIAKQWHKTRNGELTPSNITAGNDKKVWKEVIHYKEID